MADKVCRTCFNLISEEESCTFINDEKIRVLNSFIPEVNWDMSHQSVICKMCDLTLNDFCQFKKKCIETDKKFSIVYREAAEKSPLKRCTRNIASSTPKRVKIKPLVAPKIKISQSSKSISKQTFTVKKENSVTSELENEKSDTFNFDDGDEDADKFLELLETSTNDNDTKPNTLNSLESLGNIQAGSSYEKSSKVKSSLYCKICKSVIQEKTLVEHKIKSHGAKPPFRCQLCPFSTNLKISFNKHMKKMHFDEKSNLFKCTKCEYHHPEEKSFLNHVKRMHSTKYITSKYLLKCSKCDFNAKSKNEFITHSCTGPPGFNCNFCPASFATKRGLSLHLSAKHNIHTLKLLKCRKCNYEVRSKSTLMLHMQKQHKGDKTKNDSIGKLYKCDVCSFETKHEMNLVHHKSKHKVEPLTVSLKSEASEYSVLKKIEPEPAPISGEEEIPSSQDSTDMELSQLTQILNED